MAKVYMFRHQAAGHIPEFIFGQPPTQQQTDVVRRHCEIRYGTHHAKLEEPYWLQVVEVELAGTGNLPMPTEPGDSASESGKTGIRGSGGAGASGPVANGVGTVKNP